MGFVARHRLALWATAWIAAIVLALWLARGALPVFGIAIALAFILDPPVTALQRRGVPRLAGILLVYLAAVLVVIGLGWLFIPPLIEQVQRFIEELPTLGAQILEWEEAIVEWLTSLPLPDPIREALDTIIESGQQAIISLVEAFVGPLLSLIARTAAFVVGLVVIPVWLLYVLKDRERLPGPGRDAVGRGGLDEGGIGLGPKRREAAGTVLGVEGVEGEEAEVVAEHPARADRVGEGDGFLEHEVAGHAVGGALGVAAVDRQQREVDTMGSDGYSLISTSMGCALVFTSFRSMTDHGMRSKA